MLGETVFTFVLPQGNTGRTAAVWRGRPPWYDVLVFSCKLLSLNELEGGKQLPATFKVCKDLKARA